MEFFLYNLILFDLIDEELEAADVNYDDNDPSGSQSMMSDVGRRKDKKKKSQKKDKKDKKDRKLLKKEKKK